MFRPLLILILTSLLVTGCGQKGPLYLSKDNPVDSSKPVHVVQANKAVAMSGKKQVQVKKSSAVKLDEKKSGSVDNLTNPDVKPEPKTNSGTVHVSGS
jgi:predicted small lipoprotein YifL